MKLSFQNIWYPTLLIIILLISTYTHLINFNESKKLVSLIHFLLSLIAIIGLVSLNSSFAEITVKVWAGIVFLGGLLGLISVLMFLSIGQLEENVGLPTILKDLLNFFTGIIIFRFWDSSIAFEEDLEK